MPDQKPTPTDLPPIDTSKIQITITELEAPDFRFDIEVPVDLISEITTRIQGGNLNYDEAKMSQLIVQICIDEAMQRLDKDSAWGARILQESAGKYKTSEPLIFSVVIDTLPDEDFSIESIPILRKTLHVDDEMVETELFEQRLQFGTKDSYQGSLAYGDLIECDATCTLEGIDQPIFSLQKVVIPIPNETQPFQLAGMPMDEVGSSLRGSETAEHLSFDFTLPDNFPAQALQGKNGVLSLTDCTFERVTPATVEFVLEQYGTPNETLFRTQIKMSLQHNFDRENTNQMLRQLYEHLIQTVDIPISNRIVEKNYEDFCKEELASSESDELTEAKKTMLTSKAKTMVKRLTLNAWMQRTFRLSVSEDDIEKQAAIIAEERRVRPAEVKEEFLANDKLFALSNMASERKIFERLKEKMVFTDI